ncbi:MAG: HAMP domain-containing histidine kinase [Ruminococcaceae bacterium]|nr:HAMP domain-containing histidine kinase [Oscillospiraceae bacterium]
MTSLFKRYMLSYGLVIIVAFSILGGMFFAQTNSLALEEKKLTLSDTVQKAAESTMSYLSAGKEVNGFLAQQALENNFRINLMQLSSYSGASIYIANNEGLILRTSFPGEHSSQPGDLLPEIVVTQLLQTGVFSEVGLLNGFLTEPHFTQGVTLKTPSGDTDILVVVSIPAEASMRFSQNMIRIFLWYLIAIIIITLIATYLIVKQTSGPIVALSKAAQSFARGDFSRRVQLPKYHDELYTLTDSFNSMADEIMKNENERKGLIANVSHDLRTPMTTISGFVDAMIDGTIKPENQDKYLHIISDEVKRLSRLANDMVELSRFQSDTFEFTPTSFDLTEVVRRIVISFEQKIIAKNIEIDMDIPDVLNIYADRDSVFRVIYNLTDNAVKFTNQNGRMAFKISQSGGKAVMSIENSGTPIPPDEAKNVFERFYKLDKSRSENKQGAGLGLYIAKTIVGRHGGDIYATSLPDGTRFTFNLPIKGLKDEV